MYVCNLLNKGIVENGNSEIGTVCISRALKFVAQIKLKPCLKICIDFSAFGCETWDKKCTRTKRIKPLIRTINMSRFYVQFIDYSSNPSAPKAAVKFPTMIPLFRPKSPLQWLALKQAELIPGEVSASADPDPLWFVVRL